MNKDLGWFLTGLNLLLLIALIVFSGELARTKRRLEETEARIKNVEDVLVGFILQGVPKPKGVSPAPSDFQKGPNGWESATN